MFIWFILNKIYIIPRILRDTKPLEYLKKSQDQRFSSSLRWHIKKASFNILKKHFYLNHYRFLKSNILDHWFLICSLFQIIDKSIFFILIYNYLTSNFSFMVFFLTEWVIFYTKIFFFFYNWLKHTYHIKNKMLSISGVNDTLLKIIWKEDWKYIFKIYLWLWIIITIVIHIPLWIVNLLEVANSPIFFWIRLKIMKSKLELYNWPR